MQIKNREELIGNGLTQSDKKARRIALNVFERILAEAEPRRAVKNSFRLEGDVLEIKGIQLKLKTFGNIYVIGGGKAGGGMAEAVEEVLGERITKGVVNLPEGTKGMYRTSRIELNEASHPIPNERGVEGSKKMLEIAKSASEADLVIVLISGGGSALLPIPTKDISLKDIQNLTGDLLRSGAVIDEVNKVRKHLSDIKGGRLARACYPARVFSLIISDVVGDPIDMIASGPTVPDRSTYYDALKILKKYGLSEAFTKISGHLKQGTNGTIAETPKPDDRIFKRVQNLLISTNEHVLRGVLKEMSKHYDVTIYSTGQQGEARVVGGTLGRLLMKKKRDRAEVTPKVILIGGETTVTVRGTGMGGRNQELVLSAVYEIEGDGVLITSIGTDGIDGMTDAAGAIADGHSYARAVKQGLLPEEHLTNNDSYNFFKKLSDLVMTGPTGTNVNDVTILVIV